MAHAGYRERLAETAACRTHLRILLSTDKKNAAKEEYFFDVIPRTPKDEFQELITNRTI